MINSILYKEWLKTSKIIYIFLFIISWSIFDTFIDAKNSIEFRSAITAILSISQMGRFEFNLINHILSIFAICLGISQFYPEVTNGRIRLFLHLPMSHFKLISILLLSGLVLLTFIFIFITSFYFIILNSFYPKEIFEAIFTKLLPMFLSTYICYLTTMLALLEPSNIKKVLYVCISFYIVMIYSNLSISIYYANDFLNISVLAVIIIYIFTVFEVFKSYTKGYIK